MEKLMHETARRLLEAAKLVRTDIEGPADLARALNQSEQTINNWSYRGNGVSKAGRLLAQKELGISATWIEDGTGSMLVGRQHKTDSVGLTSKSHLTGIIADSSEASRASISNGPRERSAQNVTPAPPDQRRIPVISYAQAGMMTEAVDPFAFGDGFETILTDLDVSEQTFALIIEGPSMLAEFTDGDNVLIDPALSPRPSDFVVAKNGEGETFFRKYRPRGTGEHGEMVFELAPLNDDFPILHSERDHLRVIGVMVEHRKYRRR